MEAAAVVTVGALLIDSERRVLMGLRAGWKASWPNCWDAIGGHVEAGETLEAALARELKEEIGVRPLTMRHLAAMEEPRPDLHGPATHHVFAVEAWEGAPANLCDEHTEVRWFSLAEVRQLTNLAGLDYPALVSFAVERRGA